MEREKTKRPMTVRDKLTLGLILIFLASTVDMAVGTYNYVAFFPTLSHLSLQVQSLSPTKTANGTTYQATFLLENLFRYQGLSVKGVDTVLDIHGGDNKSVISYGSVPGTVKGPLEPYSPVKIESKIDIIDGTLTEFTRLNNTVGVRFGFTSDIHLGTFLEPAFLLDLTFSCSTNGSPQDCVLEATDLTATGVQVGGGGGAA
jgi:hypothetical protein